MNDTRYPPTLELHCGPVAAIDLALFAAASGDHNPLHLDESVARAAGFEQPIVHGMYTMACAARLFTTRFGASGVLDLRTRFTGVALRGDQLELVATLQHRDGNGAEYQLIARSSRGNEVLSGSAHVRAQDS